MPVQEIQHESENVTGLAGALFVRKWRPYRQAVASIVIVPGFKSHSHYYQWSAEGLAAQGYSTFALDLRGRGKSEGRRYFVESMDDYADDVSVAVELARSREPRLPVFLLGHSMGGVASCVFALKHQTRLHGFICESFAFRVYASPFALAAVRALSHIAPRAGVLNLPSRKFSRVPASIAAMDSDQHVAREIEPAATVAALARADARLETLLERITLPILILHGTADQVTRPEGSQHFHESAGSVDKTLKLYDGHYHDLFNDLDREKVLADVVGWLDARSDRSPSRPA